VATILYVEDTPGLGRMVQRLLGPEGHDVRVVETIAQATEARTKEQFDLVICDGDIHGQGNGADYAEQLVRHHQKAMIYSSQLTNQRDGVPFCAKPGIDTLPRVVAEVLK
jgi:DNA-binding NtrC family response regulator